MLRIRRARDRGHFDHGWLKTYHTFSFADYFDPANMGFQSLRVMNEDWVAPGQGFGMHPHRDMEIVTYVLEGELEHRDSLGNGEVLRPGEFQRMTAGTGIRHSEFNPSKSDPVHLYQIWLLPRAKGLPPGYEQRQIPAAERDGRLRLVASPDGAEGSLTIQQDARIYLGNLHEGQQLTQLLNPEGHGWLQVLRGSMTLGGDALHAGDGVTIINEASLLLKADAASEVMLFKLA